MKYSFSYKTNTLTYFSFVLTLMIFGFQLSLHASQQKNGPIEKGDCCLTPQIKSELSKKMPSDINMLFKKLSEKDKMQFYKISQEIKIRSSDEDPFMQMRSISIDALVDNKNKHFWESKVSNQQIMDNIKKAYGVENLNDISNENLKFIAKFMQNVIKERGKNKMVKEILNTEKITPHEQKAQIKGLFAAYDEGKKLGISEDTINEALHTRRTAIENKENFSGLNVYKEKLKSSSTLRQKSFVAQEGITDPNDNASKLDRLAAHLWTIENNIITHDTTLKEILIDQSIGLTKYTEEDFTIIEGDK